MTSTCVFCQRIERGEYKAFVEPGMQPSVVWFEPRYPVTPGHLLFVPATHVTGPGDASRNGPYSAGLATEHAARWAQQHGVWSYNLITSAGVEASQSVFHLHVHLVPRREGDGLLLPWTGQVTSGSGGRSEDQG